MVKILSLTETDFEVLDSDSSWIQETKQMAELIDK